MAFRLPRHPEAFSNAPSRGQKRPRKADDAHLKFIRELPCIVTGTRPAEPAHISFADPAWGKRERGKSEKTDDRWTLPLCRAEHDRQHSMNEISYWNSVGIDPLKTAAALWGISGDHDQAMLILRNSRKP